MRTTADLAVLRPLQRCHRCTDHSRDHSQECSKKPARNVHTEYGPMLGNGRQWPNHAIQLQLAIAVLKVFDRLLTEG